MTITSAANPHVKELIALRNRKDRERCQLTLVDGVREILRAKAAGAEFKKVYVCPEILPEEDYRRVVQRAPGYAPAVYEVSKHVLGKIAFGEREDGVVGVCQVPQKTFADIKMRSPQKPLWVVVERVEKPGNLGAIIRTCEGAGVDALIVTDPVTDVYNPNVIRASIAGVFSLAVIPATNEKTLEQLRQKKLTIVAASPQADRVYTRVDYRDPCAFVMGSEEKGLSPFWLDHADCRVKIPMQGHNDSLNVSTTAAILIYEALRQRSGE